MSLIARSDPPPNGAVRNGPAAAWARHAPALAAWTDKHLVNRRDVHGHYIAVERRADPRRTAITDKSPLTLAVLQRHFEGRDTGDLIGLHSTARDEAGCRSRWGALDIDRHDEATDPVLTWKAALAWYKRAAALGFRPLLIDSNGRGGYHLVLLFDGPAPTASGFRFLRWLCRDWEALGLAEAPETFPKQASIEPGKFGNWLRLPGRHHTREHFARVWGGSEWLDGTAAIRAILATTGTPATAIPAEALADPEPRRGLRAERTRAADHDPDRDADLARQALKYVGGVDDYARWIEVGQALACLGQEGLSLWDDWSYGGSKYQEGDCERKWKTFTSDGKRKLGTVFHLAEHGGWSPPWKNVGRTAWELDNAKRASDGRGRRADPEPDMPAANHEAAPGTTDPEKDPREPTTIARAMLGDLDARRPALHVGPTGTGKSHSIAQVVVERCRAGRATLIAVPTIRLAREAMDLIGRLAPEIEAQGALSAIFGRATLAVTDDGSNAEDDEEEDDPGGHYPIDDETRVVVCTHAQLGRRGMSQYMRAIYRKLGESDDEKRPAFAIIIDEVAEWLREARREIPLAHRRTRRDDPEGGRLVPLRDCPKSNRSGHCANCDQVRHGGSPAFNRFGIRELAHPPIIELNRQGQPLRKPRAPLEVTDADMTLDPIIHVGGTTFAARVIAWRGQAIDEWGRTMAPLYLFARDDEGHQPAETMDEVLGHMLRLAFRPVVTWEHPVTAEGERVSARTLELRKSMDDPKWDEGVVFPKLTCDVPRLRFTDLAGLEQVRRHAEAERVGVILAGATLGPDDQDALRAIWPELAVRTHPYSDRKVHQVALVMPDGYVGPGSMIGQDGRLVTAPLEAHGLGLAFCATRRVARPLYEAVCNDHPTARLAIENHMELTTRRTMHREGPVGTIITYSRGVLGLGANILGVRHLIADANAFRAIASFTPGEVSPGEFLRHQAAERAALIVQNLGRALRGEKNKTVVLFVLNADDELRAALATAPAIVEGSDLPPAVVAPERADLPQLVGQAGRWLAAGGGDWPPADPEEATRKAKPGRKPRKTREDVLAAAEAALEAGSTWDAFQRSHQPKRQLSPEEIAGLKARFRDAGDGATK